MKDLLVLMEAAADRSTEADSALQDAIALIKASAPNHKIQSALFEVSNRYRLVVVAADRLAFSIKRV